MLNRLKLNKLKIRTKILIMPLMAGVAFAIILLIAVIMGIKNNTMIDKLYQGYYPALEISHEMVNRLGTIQRELQYAVSAQDPSALDKVKQHEQRFHELTRKADSSMVFRGTEVDSIRKVFNEYFPLAQKTTLQMLEGDFSEEAIKNLARMQETYNTLQAMLNNSVMDKKKAMTNNINTISINQRSTLFNILGITILSFLFLGVVAVVIIKSITQPLQAMVKASSEMAKGVVDIELRVESDDEIGELAQTAYKLLDSSKELANAADAIGQGNYQVPVHVRSEKDLLGQAIVRMKNNLQKMTEEHRIQNWFKTGQAELGNKMRGDQTVKELAKNVIIYLARYLEADVAAIYLLEDDNTLKLSGSYAYKRRKNISSEFKIGEGLVGQCAAERQSILISNVPDDYIKISSSIGEATPLNIMVVPLVFDNQLTGVVELGSFREFSDAQIEFLEQASENISISFQSAISRIRVKELLEETQKQAEELQAQQEELRVTNEELQAQQEELRVVNEELEEQAENLKKSEELLRHQQDELKKYNEELEKQTAILKERQIEIEKQNQALEQARYEIEQKAKELELTSKYKSEFLANMSHELRTPLNSIQILSRLLYENKEKNLTEKQLQFARTIQSSGTDLLNLINEILDLSKIEAGKMTINLETLPVKMVASYVQQNFEHLTDEKNIYLKVNVEDKLPENIITDRQRVEQILKNLLSNAIKFTEKGGITVTISRPRPDLLSGSKRLNVNNCISIAVTDTGIGIPEDKIQAIFQAFQQADGTTSRKYGGTGLGLSISRELARLLQGEIYLESKEGKGSTFTLVLPEEVKEENFKEKVAVASAETAKKKTKHAKTVATRVQEETVREKQAEPVSPRTEKTKRQQDFEVRDDRHDLDQNEKSILIVEDDQNFAKILFDFTREKGYKCLIANDGESGLALANQYNPSAIILDVGLPRIDGWTVMERLKNDPATRHIPVYFISGHDKRLTAMRMGAIGFITKPVTLDGLDRVFGKIERTIEKDIRKVLVVEDDRTMRDSILELIGNEDTSITAVDTGAGAISYLKKEEFDCMVLDLGLNDMSGFDLVEKIKKDKAIGETPIIVYTGKELDKKEENRLRKHAESIIIKGAKSPERLLDEVSLFLHRIETAAGSPAKKEVLSSAGDEIFRDKKILLVDDDVRNIFALTSVLEEKGMQVVVAENGNEAIEAVKEHTDLDLVLMDIMMPEMDGYEAMTEIRKIKQAQKLPIIALTAKAMKGDRQKCINAGANDYLSKPIDVEKLLSMMHVWLYK